MKAVQKKKTFKINRNISCYISPGVSYNRTFLLKKFTGNCQNLMGNRQRQHVLYTRFVASSTTDKYLHLDTSISSRRIVIQIQSISFYARMRNLTFFSLYARLRDLTVIFSHAQCNINCLLYLLLYEIHLTHHTL